MTFQNPEFDIVFAQLRKHLDLPNKTPAQIQELDALFRKAKGICRGAHITYDFIYQMYGIQLRDWSPLNNLDNESQNSSHSNPSRSFEAKKDYSKKSKSSREGFTCQGVDEVLLHTSQSALSSHRRKIRLVKKVFERIWNHLINLETEYDMGDGEKRIFKTCEFFMEPVSREQYPSYYQMVKMPICLNDMRTRNRKNMYSSIRQIEDDISLMCSNAQTYNRPGSFVYKDSLQILEESKKEFERIKKEIKRKQFPLNNSQKKKKKRIRANSNSDENEYSEGERSPDTEDGQDCRKKKRSFNEDAEESDAYNTPFTPPLTSEIPNNNSNESLCCVFCNSLDLQRMREVVFIPCSHIIVCEICAQQCDFCPKCGSQIQCVSSLK